MLWVIVGGILVFFGFMAFVGAPYVPSQRKYVRRAFDHFGLSPSDTLVDIGSGDGVVLRIASSYGARATGYEINPLLAGIAWALSRSDSRVTVRLANFWQAAVPDATTFMYAFSVSRDEKKLIAAVQQQADRLGRPLKLLCLGSPFKHRPATETFEAYYLYTFQPLQPKKA